VRKCLAVQPNAAHPARVGRAALAEFAVTLGALACMFLSINSFLGHRLWLACGAAAGFVALGGLVVAISIRSLAEESLAAESLSAESKSIVNTKTLAAGPDVILCDLETQ
jgi:hypothetical protein